MDGPGQQKARTVDHVYQSRQENALFGLVDPMPWVGHTELIDFLDFLFSQKSDVLRRLTNSVRYLHVPGLIVRADRNKAFICKAGSESRHQSSSEFAGSVFKNRKGISEILNS
jgi:hypothetical protein